MRWWGQALVIAALVCTALLVLVLVTGVELLAEAPLVSATIALWVAIVIVDLKVGASEDKESYHHALSLDRLNYGTKREGIDFELVLSNTLPNKPLIYRVALSKLYLEINGNKQTRPDKATKGAVIPAGKSSTFLLGIFEAPRKYPYEGILHYEIDYGRPSKLLFRRITELNLYISGPTYKELKWTVGRQEDEPLNKQEQ